MTMTYDAARQHLKITDWAAAKGVSRKTVVRMINDNRLPEASQDPKGVWWIPVDAEPLPKPESGTVIMLGPPASFVESTVPSTDVDIAPQAGLTSAFGRLATLEEVAAMLDTSVGGVRRLGDAGRLDVGPYGRNGALRVYLPGTAG